MAAISAAAAKVKMKWCFVPGTSRKNVPEAVSSARTIFRAGETHKMSIEKDQGSSLPQLPPWIPSAHGPVLNSSGFRA